MDELMQDIRRYADARGISPSTVIQVAANLGGTTWRKWEEGRATCSMRTAEKIRAYMHDNPPDAERSVA